MKIMKQISIKIKRSKISNIEMLTKSIEKYLMRKLKYDKHTTKLTFSIGYGGSDFVDGFFRLIIT